MLEGNQLAEDSARQANVETTRWGLRPTMGSKAAHWWWWLYYICIQLLPHKLYQRLLFKIRYSQYFTAVLTDGSTRLYSSHLPLNHHNLTSQLRQSLR